MAHDKWAAPVKLLQNMQPYKHIALLQRCVNVVTTFLGGYGNVIKTLLFRRRFGDQDISLSQPQQRWHIISVIVASWHLVILRSFSNFTKSFSSVTTAWFEDDY